MRRASSALRAAATGELIVACSNTSEVFEAGEHALDQVALAIGFPIIRNEWLAPKLPE
jgi:hypothetical protein